MCPRRGGGLCIYVTGIDDVDDQERNAKQGKERGGGVISKIKAKQIQQA